MTPGFKTTLAAALAMTFPAVLCAQEALPIAFKGEFPRLDFQVVMPTGQSVAVECQDPQANHPYSPFDWPDAAATLEIRQAAGKSQVAVTLSDARPNTLFTMWVRLRGQDASGTSFGGNPLVSVPGKPDVGIPGTPLIPSSYLAVALDAVHEPVNNPIHGFMSDENGDGEATIDLDFPIIGGAFPFQNFVGFDPNDPKLTLNNARAVPVAIVGASGGAPFTLRLASHCVDGQSHGLLPGPHEGWFDWTMP